MIMINYIISNKLVEGFSYGCNNERNGSHDLGASGFTCLGTMIYPQMFCRSISSFECILCTKISGFDDIDVTIVISL